MMISEESEKLAASNRQLKEENARLRAEIEKLNRDMAKLRQALRTRKDSTMSTKLKEALYE